MKKILMLSLFCALMGTSAVAITLAENEKSPVQPETPATTVVFTGKVVDLSTGESLVGAEVTIEGTNIKGFTDLDGNFRIENLKPGNYNIVCSLISYKKSLLENIRLESNQKSTFEIGMEETQ